MVSLLVEIYLFPFVLWWFFLHEKNKSLIFSTFIDKLFNMECNVTFILSKLRENLPFLLLFLKVLCLWCMVILLFLRGSRVVKEVYVVNSLHPSLTAPKQLVSSIFSKPQCNHLPRSSKHTKNSSYGPPNESPKTAKTKTPEMFGNKSRTII